MEDLKDELRGLSDETTEIKQDMTAHFAKPKQETSLINKYKPPKFPQKTPTKLPLVQKHKGWFKSCSKPKICKKGNSFEFKFKALRNQASLSVKVKIPCSYSQNDAQEELPFIQSPSWGFLSPLPSLKQQARHIDQIMHTQMRGLPPLAQSYKHLPSH